MGYIEERSRKNGEAEDEGEELERECPRLGSC